ncbi:TIGR02391 family protein [Tannerella serpentiformis]|uniref:TIGR02391 family protein n=1 Tax=Tannerella serpentiformis TaxID=712710 RepID=UPI0021D1A439|nr:TIGR02391 family protein [Tannerella serpentiformis]
MRQKSLPISPLALSRFPLLPTPILPSEKSEHRGFCNLLKGLCSMFRNPAAHEPKIHWEISEQDALEILGIISYCHRRLDKAQQIRLP